MHPNIKVEQPVIETVMVPQENVIKRAKYTCSDGNVFENQNCAELHEMRLDFFKQWNVQILSRDTIEKLCHLGFFKLFDHQCEVFCGIVKPYDVAYFCIGFNKVFGYFHNNVTYLGGKYVFYCCIDYGMVDDCQLIPLPVIQKKINQYITSFQDEGIL